MPDTQKRIQISSSFTSDAEHLHEEVRDRNTNKTKIIDRSEPHSTSQKTTITTNPYTVETDGADSKVKSGDAATFDQDPSHVSATVGYDTSQL